MRWWEHMKVRLGIKAKPGRAPQPAYAGNVQPFHQASGEAGKEAAE
jgi:hypothetical protein